MESPTPVFSFIDGVFHNCYSRVSIDSSLDQGLVHSAQESEALDFFDEVMSRPELALAMEFRIGDIQLVNNFTRSSITSAATRPHTSNDNPFSESQFKTAKYHLNYPGVFVAQEDALAWARQFFHWYNHQHRHSGVAFLPPADVYLGRAQTRPVQPYSWDFLSKGFLIDIQYQPWHLSRAADIWKIPSHSMP